MHLYQGELTHKATNTNHSFIVRSLETKDQDQFTTLQQTIVDHLEDKDLLQPLTDEELSYIFEGGGLILGTFVEEKLIACRALLYPGDDPENIGRDLDLPYDEQMKVVHQEISFVHPEYRGNGLQHSLSKVIMQQLKHSSSFFTHLCSTVSPKNIPSLKDKFHQGLLIVDVKQKYDGMLRYLFYKPLEFDLKIDTASFVYIRIDKVNRHKDFIDLGYVGVGLDQTKFGNWIVFARLKVAQ